MPVNKEALIRYRAINKALIEHHIVSRDKLLEACTEAVGVDVAWRTIAGDINAMRKDELLGYFAPIENVRNEGYRYSDSNFSIDQIPLQKEEITALSFASKLLMQYSHVRIFSTFSGAIEKLNQNLDVQLRNKDEADLGNLIAFEQSTADGGSLHITELLDHIRQKTVLLLQYHSFSSGSKKSHTFHPYFIKEYRNRWYVLGYIEDYNAIRTLALERILDLKPDYSTSYLAPDFNVSDYYNHAIGMSVTNTKPEIIELEVSKSQWQYLESQPLHPSQQIIHEREESVNIRLRVIINYELKSSILSMGSSVKVLKPKRLRSELSKEALAIFNHYN